MLKKEMMLGHGRGFERNLKGNWPRGKSISLISQMQAQKFHIRYKNSKILVSSQIDCSQ